MSAFFSKKPNIRFLSFRECLCPIGISKFRQFFEENSSQATRLRPIFASHSRVLVRNGQNCINRTFSPELDPQYWAEGLRRKSQNATEVVTEMRLVGKPQLSYYFLILEALRQKLNRLPTPCLS